MTNGRWQMSVGSNIPILEHTREEWLYSQRVLSEAGYRGLTHYQTKEEAEAEAKDMMEKVVAIDQGIGWSAIWCLPYESRLPRHEDEGQCHWIRHNPGL